jgi:hypothetical protein
MQKGLDCEIFADLVYFALKFRKRVNCSHFHHARPLVEDADDKMTIQPLRPSVISCSIADNYTDGSPYHVNLYGLLSGISMSADSNGFFNGTFGVAGDEVFGLFMCYASDTDPQCQDCLDRAPGGYHEATPPQLNGSRRL